ncbi:hypothetical protein ROP_pROB02-01570 (plasmid) [Rhodococcus opacus B4]|uniref:Uncharacterized protein n=2 Tax=Rhodococcus TaxID=1827 RepID=Q6XMZ4_RHOER|nr:hypothetical protein PBD2.152 [Rhodococcus erythropolis]BAH47170.1 hypothetical protein ROP_pROB02-01570 [Rhodococcus opacus B4]
MCSRPRIPRHHLHAVITAAHCFGQLANEFDDSAPGILQFRCQALFLHRPCGAVSALHGRASQSHKHSEAFMRSADNSYRTVSTPPPRQCPRSGNMEQVRRSIGPAGSVVFPDVRR